MINLRYHVVSITAVFLALGMGLTLGSSFLDRVTVDNLKDRLDAVQERVDQTERENDLLTQRVSQFEDRDTEFMKELPGRLLSGRLAEVPTLLIATDGTDETLVTEATAVLGAAGAQLAGTWWLTDSWALDDPDEVSRLGGVLGTASSDVDRLRRTAGSRVAELLVAAGQPQPVEIDPATGQPVAEPAPTTAAATEHELIARLEDAGFLRYQALPGSGDERVLLPGASVRYVLVSSVGAASGPQLTAASIIESMTATGPAPVVAAQGLAPVVSSGKASASEDEARTTFIGPFREDETMLGRLSTVDDLDTGTGLLALVLAVEDLGVPRTGHYGVAPGASTLLPGADPSP